jgi:hypothetical protein
MSMKFWRGSGEILYAATLSNPGAPTAAEIAAGVPVSLGVSNVTGFQATVNRISVSLLAYSDDVQLNGAATFADSSLELVEDDGVGTDPDDVARRLALTTLAENTAGYLVFSRFKKKAAMLATVKVDVFSGFVGAQNKIWSMDPNVSRSQVDWISTAKPRQNVAIAA